MQRTVDAYRRYLTLRSDPEPAMIPQRAWSAQRLPPSRGGTDTCAPQRLCLTACSPGASGHCYAVHTCRILMSHLVREQYLNSAP